MLYAVAILSLGREYLMEARVTLRKDTARLNPELSELHRQKRELIKRQQQLVSGQVREAAPLKRLIARTQTSLDTVTAKYEESLGKVEQELADLNGRIEGAVVQVVKVRRETASQMPDDPVDSNYAML